jgi:hypothetical protein
LVLDQEQVRVLLARGLAVAAPVGALHPIEACPVALRLVQ